MRIPVQRSISAAILLSCGSTAFALGLGNISVQSALGQPLHASIDMLGADSGELSSSCIKARVESLDGVSLGTVQLAIMRSGPASSLVVRSRQAIHEPVAAIVVEAGCSATVRRTYQVLFDPTPLDVPVSPLRASSSETRAFSEPVLTTEKFPPAAEKSADQIVKPTRSKSQPVPVSAEKKSVPPKTDSLKPAASAIEASQDSADTGSGQNAAADVLRLTGTENIDISSLKLSRSLTEPAAASGLPLSEAQLLAQREFAVLMGDEDPHAVPDKATQAQLIALRSQMAALQHQNIPDRTALADLWTQSSLAVWLMGLLAVCLLAIGWLAWRLRSSIGSGKDHAAWWEASQHDIHTQDDAQRIPGQDAADHDLSGFIDPLASAHTALAPQDTHDRISAVSEVTPSSDMSGADIGMGLPELAGSIKQREDANEVNVEEISDVTQEAEFWLSLNNPQRAIEILEPHTTSENADSPVTWLYLLDLYREVGDEEKFNALRDRFTRLFNARVPLFGESELESQTLEDFPHLLKRICTLWENSEIVPFLQSLLIDDRAGARAGFDLPLYRDILLLIGIAMEKRRLNQLREPQAEVREMASLEIPLPTIEPVDYATPVFTEDGAIDFAPLEFNFNLDDEAKPTEKLPE